MLCRGAVGWGKTAGEVTSTELGAGPELPPVLKSYTLLPLSGKPAHTFIFQTGKTGSRGNMTCPKSH